MQIAVGSAFRNSSGAQIQRWLRQVSALRGYLYENTIGYALVRAIAVEGDSADRTRDELMHGSLAYNLDIDLRTCSHGGPVYGSTENPERLVALSRVGNAILEDVRQDDDYLLYVESDLIWSPKVIASLLSLVIRGECDIACPLVMAGDKFYDIFLYRRNGVRFSPFHPYHPDLNGMPLLIDSAGSCLMMHAKVARTCRMTDNALLDFCQDARSKGYSIKVDPSVRVEHPV